MQGVLEQHMATVEAFQTRQSQMQTELEQVRQQVSVATDKVESTQSGPSQWQSQVEVHIEGLEAQLNTLG